MIIIPSHGIKSYVKIIPNSCIVPLNYDSIILCCLVDVGYLLIKN